MAFSPPVDMKVPRAVIPSEARDLVLFVLNKKQQMPRYARHDSAFFHQPPSLEGYEAGVSPGIDKIGGVRGKRT